MMECIADNQTSEKSASTKKYCSKCDTSQKRHKKGRISGRHILTVIVVGILGFGLGTFSSLLISGYYVNFCSSIQQRPTIPLTQSIPPEDMLPEETGHSDDVGYIRRHALRIAAANLKRKLAQQHEEEKIFKLEIIKAEKIRALELVKAQEMQKLEMMNAEKLPKEVRVLCWVLTQPENHINKAMHVKATWGQRCNRLLFISSKTDETLGSIGIPNITDSRNNLWAMTRAAFEYVYKYHSEEADWFLKADDDTYVIVENLRLFLKEFNSTQPMYFGCKHQQDDEQGCMIGGEGYVLSKEAVRRFVEVALPNKELCNQEPGMNEDLELGNCLANVGVEAEHTPDRFGRYRFNAFHPEPLWNPGTVPRDFGDWRSNYHPRKEGPDCCADLAITFHYVPPKMMHLFEYMIYHLHPYDITQLNINDGNYSRTASL